MSSIRTIEELTRMEIAKAMSGDPRVTDAAKALGIGVKTLYRRLVKSWEVVPLTKQKDKLWVSGPRGDLSQIRPLKEIEQEEIAKAMALSNKNIAMAAEALGISVETLYRKLKPPELRGKYRKDVKVKKSGKPPYRWTPK